MKREYEMPVVRVSVVDLQDVLTILSGTSGDSGLALPWTDGLQ